MPVMYERQSLCFSLKNRGQASLVVTIKPAELVLGYGFISRLNLKARSLAYITHISRTINERASRSDFTWNCCARMDCQMPRVAFIYKQE